MSNNSVESRNANGMSHRRGKGDGSSIDPLEDKLGVVAPALSPQYHSMNSPSGVIGR